MNRDTIYVYDSLVPVSYGLWVCPECHAEFYGGGKALHKPDCGRGGYDGLEFHFGPSQVEAVKRCAEMFGKDHRWYGISLAMLERDFPELLEETPRVIV